MYYHTHLDTFVGKPRDSISILEALLDQLGINGSSLSNIYALISFQKSVTS